MKRRQSKSFWDREYQRPAHLALSTAPAADLEKFTRWQERHYGREFLNPQTQVLDLGCGNGRNLIFLAQNFACRGLGYDVSGEAIAQAKRAAINLPLQFSVRSLRESLPVPDGSVNLVLDMMVSHILNEAERRALRAEIYRVLKPGGWLFFKSFLLEEDDHAKRLLRDHPAEERHTYQHPRLGVAEHVWTVDELEDFFLPDFEIHKVEKSHKHRSHGRAFRRRTLAAYLQKVG